MAKHICEHRAGICRFFRTQIYVLKKSEKGARCPDLLYKLDDESYYQGVDSDCFGESYTQDHG